jgi:uncharacterized protein YuzE
MNKLIKYRYDSEWDILHLASLAPVKAKYETSRDITEDRPVGLVADLTTEGRCIGIEFWNAAEQLLPHLLPDEFHRTCIKTALIVDYDKDSDTLYLHAGKPANYSQPVIEGWTAHYDTNKDPSENGGVGEIVGITLECAAENFLSDLLQYATSEHDPEKQERMRRFRRSSIAG